MSVRSPIVEVSGRARDGAEKMSRQTDVGKGWMVMLVQDRAKDSHELSAAFDAARDHVLLATSPQVMARLTDAGLIDAIAALERLKGTVGASQAALEVAFRDSQIRAQKDAGVPREKVGRGIADQIALARRITPKQASDQLALRRVLVETMPRTTGLLATGEISEWGAHRVAQACLVLDDADRDRVDG